MHGEIGAYRYAHHANYSTSESFLDVSNSPRRPLVGNPVNRGQWAISSPLTASLFADINQSRRKWVEAKNFVLYLVAFGANGASGATGYLTEKEVALSMRRIVLIVLVAVMMAAMLMLYIGPASGAATITVKGSNMPTTQPCETADQTTDGGGASFEDKKGGKWCYRQLP